MQHSCGMAHVGTQGQDSLQAGHKESQQGGGASRTVGYSYRICDKLWMGLVLVIIVRSSDVLAADQQAWPGKSPMPDFTPAKESTPMAAAIPATPSVRPSALLPPAASHRPMDLKPLELPQPKTAALTEFRPRRPSLSPPDVLPAEADAPLMSSTTVWQRLSEYRANNRVRVVTLWETGGSSVSLLAGRKGDPTLQWTSRLTSRGSGTRGVLDEFLSSSLGGMSRGLHWGARAAGTEPYGKSGKSADLSTATGPMK